VRRLLNTRTLTAVVSVLALSGVWAGVAQASDPLAYVTNEQSGTISEVDLATGVVGTPITVGTQPDGIAITPDGATAYVADFGSSEVVPVTLATGAVGSPIALNNRPSAIALTPDGKTAYVISDTGFEYPITLATGEVGNPSLIPSNSDAFAIASSDTAYIADAADATLRPLSLSSGSLGQPINLDSTTPDGIAISPDGATAYITSSAGGTVAPDVARRSATTETSGTITPVSLSTGTIGVPIQTGGEPSGIAISADGSTAYVTDLNSGNLTPVTLATGVLGTPISVGAQPSAIALVPAAGIAAAPAPAPSASGSTSTSSTTTLGNQVLTLTVSPPPGGTSSTAQACHAPNSTLGITLKRRTIKHAAKLKFRYANFKLGTLAKRAKRLPATARFSLRGLKAGAHKVTVRAFYTEMLARAGRSRQHKLAVTISKSLTTRFSVC
jgi:YVTN family beta-propeller protein